MAYECIFSINLEAIYRDIACWELNFFRISCFRANVDGSCFVNFFIKSYNLLFFFVIYRSRLKFVSACDLCCPQRISILYNIQHVHDTVVLDDQRRMKVREIGDWCGHQSHLIFINFVWRITHENAVANNWPKTLHSNAYVSLLYNDRVWIVLSKIKLISETFDETLILSTIYTHTRAEWKEQ